MVGRSLVAAAAVSLFVFAAPVSAQQQEGLVNLNISDNNTVIQVPVAVAVQLCDISANVIAEKRDRGETACNITQEQANEANLSGPGLGQGQGQQAQQEGLVNINVEGNQTALQVPVAVAVQLCDVSANVIAKKRDRGETACTISQAQANEANLSGPGLGQGQRQGQSQEQGLSTEGQTNQDQQNQQNQTEQQ